MKRRAWMKQSMAGVAIASSWNGLAAFGQAQGGRKIKVAQMGVGHAHATKLQVYRQSPDYEVVGIAEPDDDLRNRAKKLPAYEGLKWFSMEDILSMSEVEVVLVETRVRDLLPTAQRCIEANKHVHIDKPAGNSMPQWLHILKAAEERKRLVQMGYMYRYNPGILLMRELVAKGWLGEIFEVHTVMSKVVDDAARQELAEFRGGIFFELACHVLDLVIHLLGEPQRIVSSMKHSSSKKDELIDNGLLMLEYPRATATVRSSAIEIDGGDRRHFVVCGTEGTLHIQPLDNPTAKLTLSQPRGAYKKGTQVIEFPKYTRYVADAADMGKILNGEKQSDYTYQHDALVQKVLLEACGMLS